MLVNYLLGEYIKMSQLYLIKDLASKSGYSIHTLKYYLNIGLIKECGRFPETNFRYFDNNNIEQLAKIRQLRKDGKSIRVIRKILDEGEK